MMLSYENEESTRNEGQELFNCQAEDMSLLKIEEIPKTAKRKFRPIEIVFANFLKIRKIDRACYNDYFDEESGKIL